MVLFKRRSRQHHRSYKNNSHDPFFNFECLNRLPIRCRRKFLTFLGLQKHLKKGMWYLSGYDHGSIWRLSVPKVGGSNLHSIIPIQRKFSVKRKKSMIYGPTTTVFHSQPSDTYWARLGKKTEHPKKPGYCPIKCLLIIANK